MNVVFSQCLTRNGYSLFPGNHANKNIPHIYSSTMGVKSLQLILSQQMLLCSAQVDFKSFQKMVELSHILYERHSSMPRLVSFNLIMV